jgi:predicted RNase H-like nuclease (RuvC/YqgF family)
MRSAHILGCIFLGLCLSRLPAPGQDAAATNAAAVAEQQGVEERFKQIAADIESLRAANEALGDKLSALKADMQQIRAEQTRLAGNSASSEDLKALASKIEEVDKKRLDDKETISDQIKQTAIRLERLLADATPAPPKPPQRTVSTNDGPATGNGVIYTIKEGDTLTVILKFYNADLRTKGLKTITQKQAEDANPSVDWKHLKVGQQIVIPTPPE